MKKPKTVRMTVREFASSLGLQRTGIDYIGTTVLMRLLCRKKIARKVGKIAMGAMGRPSDLFEVPVEFTIKGRRRKSSAA